MSDPAPIRLGQELQRWLVPAKANGSYPTLDSRGNPVYQEFGRGGRIYYDTSKGYPVGTNLTLDNWGNSACRQRASRMPKGKMKFLQHLSGDRPKCSALPLRVAKDCQD